MLELIDKQDDSGSGNKSCLNYLRFRRSKVANKLLNDFHTKPRVSGPLFIENNMN